MCKNTRKFRHQKEIDPQKISFENKRERLPCKNVTAHLYFIWGWKHSFFSNNVGRVVQAISPCQKSILCWCSIMGKRVLLILNSFLYDLCIQLCCRYHDNQHQLCRCSHLGICQKPFPTLQRIFAIHQCELKIPLLWSSHHYKSKQGSFLL